MTAVAGTPAVAISGELGADGEAKQRRKATTLGSGTMSLWLEEDWRLLRDLRCPKLSWWRVKW